MEGLYRIEMKMIPECAGGRLKKRQIKFYQSEYLKSGIKEKAPEQSFIQIFGFRKDSERHYSKSPDSRLGENDGKSSFYFNRPCFQTTFFSQTDD